MGETWKELHLGPSKSAVILEKSKGPSSVKGRNVGLG